LNNTGLFVFFLSMVADSPKKEKEKIDLLYVVNSKARIVGV
jgi:hypothetical protein